MLWIILSVFLVVWFLGSLVKVTGKTFNWLFLAMAGVTVIMYLLGLSIQFNKP